MSWNSLCALGFHSAGYMLSPGNSGNEAMRPVVTRENSLALQCCLLWFWQVSPRPSVLSTLALVSAPHT